MPNRQPRTSKLTTSLEKRLNAYALTAAVVGFGAAFTAPDAAAKVVYFPVTKTLTSGSFTLPLEGSGGEAWTFVDGFHMRSLTFDNLSVRPLNGAAVFVGNGYAEALAAGASIGPDAAFQSSPIRMEKVEFLSDSSLTMAYGPWANVSNRYLGLRFVLNGEMHYGWARFSVANTGSLTGGLHIKATFTGYAVETLANRPIQAGTTSGPEEDAGASLGCLAAGCNGRKQQQESK
jgi:hypothetical protein